ncbi:glycosyltransferase family 2 protein [Methylocystis parvus]|uniref:Glycosyltransferase family 2 protein n=1 Tax=Methylocystis parvus TaxID=134 RepID=A0A6B8M9G6_9HYPH|nr:glycosyltransferase family 2 protein [Methylocystis parvus]QGM99055.1 glycosyltransferase family 2 protein [Methylocystis parvus]WBK00578.1 glycosyltransferase family 2 protein [Methylocystis parvus OBBP]
MAKAQYLDIDVINAIDDRKIIELPRVSAVIPTLNEENNLPIILPRLPPWINEVVIVDGCSTDHTVEVAQRLRPDATIVLETKRGKGAALRAGFQAVTGDITMILDADGSMDPGESIMLVGALMAGADFAKGSRFIQGGGTDDMTWFRMTGNWGLTQAVRLLFGGTYSDLCYGYLAFWTRHRDILEPTCDGFEVETFLNIKALKSGLKIVEVPSFEAPRVFGESNLKPIKDGWRVLKTILRERLPQGQSAL